MGVVLIRVVLHYIIYETYVYIYIYIYIYIYVERERERERDVDACFCISNLKSRALDVAAGRPSASITLYKVIV